MRKMLVKCLSYLKVPPGVQKVIKKEATLQGRSTYLVKRRSRRLRPKAHILEDPLGNPYNVLSPRTPTKVLYGAINL